MEGPGVWSSWGDQFSSNWDYFLRIVLRDIIVKEIGLW